MIDVPELRRLYRVKRFDFWIATAAVLGVLSVGRARRRRDRDRALARLARLRRDRSRACRCSDGSPAPRCSATWPTTPATRRFAGIAVCASTAACSSRPPTRSRNGLERSSLKGEEPLHAVVLDLEGVDPRRFPGLRQARARSSTSRRAARSSCDSPASSPPSRRCSTGTASCRRLGQHRIHGNVHRAVEAQLAADRHD